MPKAAATQRTAPEDHYRIAAVSKLAGIALPTIRMWERRYNVVTPARSAANGRLYSRANVDRLILLKSAVDAGHAISTVAGLSNRQLHARLKEAPRRGVTSPRQDFQVLVCGNALAQRLHNAWAGRSDIRINASLPSLTPKSLKGVSAADAVIVEISTPKASSIPALRHLSMLTRAQVMIVVYGFSTRQTLARLDQEGIIALASPAEPTHLARICHLGLAMETPSPSGVERLLLQPARPRRYDDDFLATTARLPTTVPCECPNHLADLLTKLNAFEQYSLECESADAVDASIHALLYATAAQCRELLEHALHRVLEHETPIPAAAHASSVAAADR